MDISDITLALLLTAAGTALLFAAWKRRLPRPAAVRWGGWGLLAAALVFWIAGTGAEFGLVLGALVPALGAWALVWGNAELPANGKAGKRSRRPEPDIIAREDASAAPAQGNPWLRHALLFLLSVPFAAAAATVVSIAVADLLPWSQLNRDILVGLLMPFLWGLAAAWLCADDRLRRPFLALAGAGLLSGAFVFGV